MPVTFVPCSIELPDLLIAQVYFSKTYIIPHPQLELICLTCQTGILHWIPLLLLPVLPIELALELSFLYRPRLSHLLHHCCGLYLPARLVWTLLSSSSKAPHQDICPPPVHYSYSSLQPQRNLNCSILHQLLRHTFTGPVFQFRTPLMRNIRSNRLQFLRYCFISFGLYSLCRTASASQIDEVWLWDWQDRESTVLQLKSGKVALLEDQY